MSRVIVAAIAGTVLLLSAQSSEARARHHHDYQRHAAGERHHHRYNSATRFHRRSYASMHGRRYAGGGRPGAWCGWYMRHVVGSDPGAQYNLARNWAHYGAPAHGPSVGAIVVWSHHVGKIVGQASNGEWVVQSGNDGHGVRTRPRSLARAIAFRWPA